MPFDIGWLELLFMVPMLFVGAAFYFLPSILAFARHHHNILLIFLINILLGWTVLGWIAALILVFVEPGSVAPANASVPASALEIAKQRYAKGQITQAEFEEIKKTIS